MLAGLILLIAVVVWLVYVMWSLKSNAEIDELGIATKDAIDQSMMVVHSGQTEIKQSETVAVSTPEQRQTSRLEAKRIAHRGVLWRRAGLVMTLVASAGLGVGVWLLPVLTTWWLTAIPGLFLSWLVAARISLVVNQRHSNDLLAGVDQAWQEETRVLAPAPKPVSRRSRDEQSVDLSVPLEGLSSLSEPLPVAPRLQSSKPVLPRSVSRVSLAAPAATETAFPVTADYPQDALPFDTGEEESSGWQLAVGQ